jgi:MoaA/NifB/PqqE/SkfB family radical SAM enzyme
MKQRRPKGFMDVTLAQKILKQIGELKGPAWVALHGAGEPLLHKDLPEILRHAGNFSNIDFGFLTNCMLLDETAGKTICDAGLSWIGFSIDGIDWRKFEKYRIGSEYDRVLSNALRFLELKERKNRKITVRVNMTVQDEMLPDVDAFVAFWLDKVDEVLISPSRPVGSRTSSLVQKGMSRIPCYMLYEMMVVFWDGKVGLCCEDWFNEQNLGDASTDTLDIIWNGRRFSQIRRSHEKGRFNSKEECLAVYLPEA